jgi:hypothetical protein
MAWRDLVRELERFGLQLDRNYYLVAWAAGNTIPSGHYPGEEPFAIFDEKSLATLLGIDVRLRVSDITGDVHARTLRLLHIAPAPYPRVDVSEGDSVVTTHGRKIRAAGKRPRYP